MKLVITIIGMLVLVTGSVAQKRVKLEDGSNAESLYYYNGNLGVSFINPLGKLNVYSNSQTGATTNSLVFGSNSADISSMFKVTNHGQYKYSMSIGSYWGETKGTDVSNMLTFKNRSIGIGVSDPTGGLHIYSNSYTGKTTNSLVFGSNSGDISSMFKITNHGAYKYSMSIGSYWGDTKGVDVPGILTLKNNRVGILSQNPAYALDVYGTIRTKELIVDMKGAPDYVFKSGYNLRSIKDVDRFIKKNEHLPDMPSAREFEESGVAQSEMNKKLLQKIEELTLYVIKINQKNEVLQKRVDELEQK